jgi:uncharacterized protein (DUF362 family)
VVILSRVAVVKGSRGHEPVFRALDLIDFKSAISGFDRVLIKVNFITTKTWDTGATTDPIVVEAIILKLKSIPVEVQVVESDATVTNATKAFKVTGMAEMCERNDVKWVNLKHLTEKVDIPIEDGLALKKITVPRLVKESAIISAAKLKTHMSTKVTLGMKNMFGLLPTKLKFKYHLKGMSKVIVDINTVLRPAITVIDGFVAMEGKGPTKGNPVQMDTIIAGADLVATDATGCRVMGFDPHNVSHIKRAYEKNLGEIDKIQIVGDGIDQVKRSFKKAKI